MAMALKSSKKEPLPHSKYIPTADRGWETPENRSSSSRPSSSSTSNTGSRFRRKSLFDENGDATRRDRRLSKTALLASLWQAPKKKLKEWANSEGDDEGDRTESELEGEEEENERRPEHHPRERSNSMPTSLMTDDTSHTSLPAGKDLEREFSVSSTAKRRSVHLPPSARDLFIDGPPTSTDESSATGGDFLLRRQRTASSLEVKDVPQIRLRGYPWRREADNGGRFISPTHRNPTGKQAFYDTHFGSSSGWRSVAGIADDYLHPLESGRAALGRLTGSKKEKPPANTRNVQPPPFDEEKKRDSFFTWNGLYSIGAFGMGTSKEDKDGLPSDPSSSSRSTNAFEPELIPTIHRDTQAHRYFKNLHGNVVILGGYRGSTLRDAETNQMMWVPLKVGVGLRRPTLELGLSSEDEDRSEERVIASEMLSGIGSMVDMGRRLINRCSSKRSKVYSWGYDWRLSLGRSSERLEAYLHRLWEQSAEQESDRKGAKVIAHSMGGLVALHALTRTKRPEIFDSLVFASTPFLGTANILGPFRFGDAALFNDEICSPRATFSFRSSFYLLPTDPGEGEEDGTKGGRCFEEEDGTPHDLDFLDAETWDDLGFSPCVELGKRKEVLEKSKKRAREQGRTLFESLERSASIREEQGVHRRFDASAKSDIVPSFPGPDMQLVPSSDTTNDGSESMPNGQAAISKASDGVVETAKAAGQSAMKHVDSHAEDERTLQEANRQDTNTGTPNQSGTKKLSETELETIMEDEATSSWLYLERALAEMRTFVGELRHGFDEGLYKAGRYPPMAILTSGRTPTVRGALISSKTREQDGKDAWKSGVREGDYSRMLYAPGDGVILRRSATTLPGQWGKLLVRGKGDKDLTNEEGVVETSHRHVTLLSDVDGIGRCLEACRLARVAGA